MKSTVNKGQRKLCQEDADSLTLFKTLLCEVSIRCLLPVIFSFLVTFKCFLCYQVL